MISWYFMALAGHQDDIFISAQADGRFNGLFPSAIVIHFFCRCVNTSLHLFQYFQRIFKPGLSDVKITLSLYWQATSAITGLFVLSPVSATAHHGNDLFNALAQFFDRGQYIQQCIRRMRIIYDADNLIVFAHDVIESSFGPGQVISAAAALPACLFPVPQLPHIRPAGYMH